MNTSRSLPTTGQRAWAEAGMQPSQGTASVPRALAPSQTATTAPAAIVEESGELLGVGRSPEEPVRIGASLPRKGIERLLRGRGRYVDDLQLPRMVHAAMVRSPYAHARIRSIDIGDAEQAPGVVAVFTAKDLNAICKPWVGTLKTAPGMRSPEQSPLAGDRVCWQGEAVAIVVAESRAMAEDAAELVWVDWEPLPVQANDDAALEPDAVKVHEEYENNLCYRRDVSGGDVEAGLAQAHHVVRATLRTGRHTHMPLEPRVILADFNPADRQLHVWHSSQAPHMTQWLLAHHFGLPESQVRVSLADVGGSFGLKIQFFGDEVAAVGASILLGRPVKFIADRIESFQSDLHARGHVIDMAMGVAKNGEITGVKVYDKQTFGPYGSYPRAGVGEGNQVINLIGAPYRNRNYQARLDVAFQNKVPIGPYRAVGHPVACFATEVMLDEAARKIGMDPVEIRRRNLIPDDAYPWQLAAGPVLDELSMQAALERLVQLCDYENLRRDQAEQRRHGVYRGIGIANFVEMTNPSSLVYGAGGAPIAGQDACMLRLTAGGAVHCAVGVAEFGQGATMALAQIVAATLSVPLEQVRVMLGDTDITPYGGGNWGSRGTGIAGEAVLQAALELRQRILRFAAHALEKSVDELMLCDGWVCAAAGGAQLISLEELGRRNYFRPDLTPAEQTPELMVTRSFAQRRGTGVFTNGVQASWVEVDVEIGSVKLLKHWVVEDCGTIINPLLVDEQLRGGVVQGIGAALYEEVLYNGDGQLLNASLADYLVPMAAEMPDIEIAHLQTPTKSSQLGAKGAGEAGVAGASAAVVNAINDAIAPLNGFVTQIPATPERILQALGRVSSANRDA